MVALGKYVAEDVRPQTPEKNIASGVHLYSFSFLQQNWPVVWPTHFSQKSASGQFWHIKPVLQCSSYNTTVVEDTSRISRHILKYYLVYPEKWPFSRKKKSQGKIMSSWWILATDAISVMNSRGSSSHKEGSFTLRGRLVLKKNSDGVIPAIITDKRNCAFATNSPRHVSQKKTSNHYNPSVLLMICLSKKKPPRSSVQAIQSNLSFKF